MKPVEKMSYIELIEAQTRHKKILSNKALLQKLPDKGKKFIETRDKIEDRLLKYKQEEDELSNMFTGMTLTCPRVDVNQMEWTGKTRPDVSSLTDRKPTSTSEEDERDIVNILVTTNQMNKIVIDEREQSSPSPDHKRKNCSQEPFYQHLADKVEHLKPTVHKFKPFRTLRHEKSPTSKQSNIKWENTAATPPTFKYNDGAKTVNLEESVELQLSTGEKIKLLELERAGFKISPDTAINPAESEEVYDEEPEGGGGIVSVCIPTEADEID